MRVIHLAIPYMNEFRWDFLRLLFGWRSGGIHLPVTKTSVYDIRLQLFPKVDDFFVFLAFHVLFQVDIKKQI